MSAWTNVPKPTESSVTSSQTDAEPIGMLIAITSLVGSSSTLTTPGWTDVDKPTSSVWTMVVKPTN